MSQRDNTRTRPHLQFSTLFSQTPNTSNPQSGSHFFKLPLEIRHEIFRLVIYSWGWGRRIHIKRRLGLLEGLSMIPCRRGENPPTDSWSMPQDSPFNSCCLPCSRNKRATTKLDIERLGIFFLCRRSWVFISPSAFSHVLMSYRYLDSIHLLYASFDFELLHLDGVHQFLTTIPKIAHTSFRSLHIVYLVEYHYNSINLKRYDRMWSQCCTIVRQMTGLNHLTVQLFNSRHFSPLLETKYLAPFFGFEIQTNDFVVQLPCLYAEDPDTELVGKKSKADIRFRIERRRFWCDERRLPASRTPPPHFAMMARVKSHIMALFSVPWLVYHWVGGFLAKVR